MKGQQRLRLLDPTERDNVIYFSSLRDDPLPDELYLEECETCEGHGTEICISCDGAGYQDCVCSECGDAHARPCDTCRGEGSVGPCPACAGTGAVDGRTAAAPPPVDAPVLPGLEAWC